MPSVEYCVSVCGRIVYNCIFKINNSRAFMLEWNNNTNIFERLKIKLPPSRRSLTQESGLIITRLPKINPPGSALPQLSSCCFCLSCCLAWRFSPIGIVIEFVLRSAFSRGACAPFVISGWYLSS